MTSRARRIDAALARVQPERLLSLLVDSVDAYSPSFDEEPATSVFARHLKREGISYERQRVPHHAGSAARSNLLIRVGREPLGLLLVGHVDTIPSGNGRMEFTGATVMGDTLVGLGSADMKSGCAAMVEAALAMASSDVVLDRGLGVALVVGEEEYGDGSSALPAAFNAPLVVVGEPTSLLPCVDHFGYMECRFETRGTRSHAALPSHGANAIHGMLAWLLAVLDGLSTAYPVEGVAVSPRLIRGGDTLFIVPDECAALLDVHWKPGVNPSRVLEIIERTRNAVFKSHPGCQLAFEKLFESKPYANGPDHPRLDPLRLAFERTGLDWAPGVFRSHSDAGLFQDRGSVTVVCGPGALEAAHAPGESVSLHETEAAARLYTALAMELCAT